MSLVASLLQAIVNVDGESLVIGPGATPYVLAASGHVELATRPLSLEAVTRITTQLLPRELLDALEEFGFIQYHLPQSEFANEHFTVVATRGDEDASAEIRRRPSADDDRLDVDVLFGDAPRRPERPWETLRAAGEAAVSAMDTLSGPLPDAAARAMDQPLPWAATPAAAPLAGTSRVTPAAPAPPPAAPAVEFPGEHDAAGTALTPPAPPEHARPQQALTFPDEPRQRWHRVSIMAVPGVVSSLERLLRAAAAHGASALYLASGTRPSIRVNGTLQTLDAEPVLPSTEVVSLMITAMPDRAHEALRSGATTEWVCDIEDIGRVRCISFTDHRGPGGIFRLMPVGPASAADLELSGEIQSLAIEPEGLVLVAGPRSSGKRTLIAALVDLVNRTRRDHVITIEGEINVVYDRGSSFISQREVRGDEDEMIAAARAALREDPDVLVIDRIRTGRLMNVALEAAGSGRLVIAGFTAHTATESIDRLIDLYAPEYSRQVRLALADTLLGVVVQVLLPKKDGGRVPVRELLLNTPAVSRLIAEGQTSQLPMAIEAGRPSGMIALKDGIFAHVERGAVDIREAYRYVRDRPGFLALLERQGLDTSFAQNPS